MPATKNRRRLLAATLLALLCALAGCARAPHQPARPYSPLILISIDGYRADYITRGLSPNLATLASKGVRAEAMKPAFPTLTFPNHYTIVTGLYPDHHGIVNNRFTDPVTGANFVYKQQADISDPHWWGGEPLWVGVQRQGKRAATMFWPGSDVAIDGVRPQHWRQYDGNFTPTQRVEQVLQWLDLPNGQRPDFVTLYLEQVDHAGHEYGPDSPQVDAALREDDAALGRLVAGLKQRGIFPSTNIVVVSDHGMTATSPDRLIVLDKFIDMRNVTVITAGVLAGLVPKSGHEAGIDRALLAAHAHMRCWNKADIPARLHYGSNARIPPIVCVADDGWLIETQSYLDRPKHYISRGDHGYDNDDPNMRALFVAEGPAFRRGIVVPEFANVDVYPLLTRILGIKPAPNDGDIGPVAGMLAP
ncbi:MAG: alkaline phosphatase family protein [Proteobacteria bacterium]|nr:alkaline phosphatase family protein [Pseudomonadota bacterium]